MIRSSSSRVTLPYGRALRCGTWGLILLLASTACEPTPEPPADVAAVSLGSDPRRMEVLFLGHESEHHNSRAYAPILAAALGAEGINISYTEDPADLNPRTLALHDAVIVYANHSDITPDQEESLLEFVASGGGFIPIHSASYSFRNSEAYVRLVGAQFETHGTGIFTADIVAPDHPVLDDIEPFETWDETYVHHEHNPDRTVLMERTHEEGSEPWSWVRAHGEGRVFYTAYGHDRRTWEQPMFHRLIRNAILWTVGDEVRAQLEAFQVPPLRYVENPPAPIPNYEGRPEPLLLQEPLPPEESLRHWQVPPGFELQLFAAEPDIVNPIAMAWDELGRLWVVETVDYPNDLLPPGEGNDVIRILEDTNGDGRADRFTVFAEGLNIPTGIVFADGGVIVSQAPELLFLKDTTGDDRADVRETIMTGWGIRDTHAGPSNLHYGFDNRLWGSVGYAGYNDSEAFAQINPEGGRWDAVEPDELRFGAGIFSFDPDGSDLEFVSSFTNNTWGLGFSEEFDIFGSTANNEHSVFVAIPNRYYMNAEGLQGVGRMKIDGHYAMHPITFNIRQVDSQGGFTSAAGHNLYTARSFPEEYWNRTALVSDPTGHLLHKAILEKQGSGFREVDGWNLMASADEWASPVHAQVGPDGAVWVLDWYNFIIQHNPTPPGFEAGRGAAYETPIRDRRHGRIYRLAWKGAHPYEPLSLSPERPDELLTALRHPNMFWRMTAQRLLVERGETDVLRELLQILGDQSVDRIGLNSPAVHAIWTVHGLGSLDGSDAVAERRVREALRHPAAGVRKNAMMALPKTGETGEAIVRAGLLEDADLNVQLHALLALSEIPPSGELGRQLFAYGTNESLLEDDWLPTALFLAALQHSDGFLTAYAEAVGPIEFARVAGRVARGELDEEVDWSGPALDDREWETIPVPQGWRPTPLGAFTGVVWFRREVELPLSAGDAAGTLSLGAVRDSDVAYVNGVRVGSTTGGFGAHREYAVPEGVLRAGRNLVTVQVSNERGEGGIMGDPEDVFLSGSDFRVSLAETWKYRREVEWPGNRRPDFTPAVPFVHQFLRFHNPVGSLARSDEDLEGGSDVGTGVVAEGTRLSVALGAVPGENRFDRTEISVRPGQQVRLSFDNTDDMPHNVVVLDAGVTLEAAGEMLDAFISEPGSAAADFIPDALPVRAIMPMLDPRESATLTFTAPAEPGEYLFVCTFPGHWMTMWGVLRVEG